MYVQCRSQKHSSYNANSKTARDLTTYLTTKAANATLAPYPTTTTKTSTNLDDLTKELNKAITNVKSLIYKVKIQAKEQVEAINAIRAIINKSAYRVILYANKVEDSTSLATYYARLVATSTKRATATLTNVQSTTIAYPIAIPITLPIDTILTTSYNVLLSLNPSLTTAIIKKQPKDLYELLKYLIQTNDYLKAKLRVKDNTNE